MSSELEERENELIVLQSIFDPGTLFRDESKFSGEIRVSVDLSADFNVVLREGETLRQYEISFLPPLLLTFDLPEDYPTSSPPSFSLTCSWLTHTQIAALSAQLVDLYQATGGAVVLFSWVQFLREDALKFLDIQNVLELPSDGHITLQGKPNAASSGEKNCPHTSSANDQCCEPGVSAASSYTDPQQASIDQNEVLKEGDVSACDPDDPDAQGAASVQEHRSLSDICPTPSQALLSQILIHDAAEKEKAFDRTVFDCGVCFMSQRGSDCVQLSECGHVFCRACLGEFCKLQITEGNVRSVTCPQAGCTTTPTPTEVLCLVGEELFSRYDRLLLKTTLDCMPDVVYCPRLSCSSAVILEKSGSAGLCSACGFAFCVSCRKTYHGKQACEEQKLVFKNTTKDIFVQLPKSEEGRKALWDDYATSNRARKRLLESRYSRQVLLGFLESGLSETWITTNSKACPHCFCKIQKNGGCNVMTCYTCRQLFCWSCLSGLTNRNATAHFELGTCVRYQP